MFQMRNKQELTSDYGRGHHLLFYMLIMPFFHLGNSIPLDNLTRWYITTNWISWMLPPHKAELGWGGETQGRILVETKLKLKVFSLEWFNLISPKVSDQQLLLAIRKVWVYVRKYFWKLLVHFMIQKFCRNYLFWKTKCV